MTTRVLWLAVAAILGPACVTDPLEGTGSAAEEGTRVEVMLVPLDDGATPSQGAGAFDEGLETTESLAELADGDGAFVVGVTEDGQWGIALVPMALTDDAEQVAAGAADDGREVDAPDAPGDLPQDDEPAFDDEQEPAPDGCAADCDEWCASTLDLCSGDGFAECDCGSGEEPPPSDCVATCDEWCTSWSDLCGGDGAVECDCSASDEPAGDAECVWTCEEWCTGSSALCDGDGWDLCGDACGWNESRALPASASAGALGTTIVVAGIVLVIVYTDPEVQQALDRGESIASAVGGVYGQRAREAWEKIRRAGSEIGQIVQDARSPCADLLPGNGFRERLDVTLGDADTVNVGICSYDQFTVWPRDITIRGGASRVRFRFWNMGSGARGWTYRDATAAWTDGGEPRVLQVPEGQTASADVSVLASFRFTVEVPADSFSTQVAVNVAR